MVQTLNLEKLFSLSCKLHRDLLLCWGFFLPLLWFNLKNEIHRFNTNIKTIDWFIITAESDDEHTQNSRDLLRNAAKEMLVIKWEFVS